MKGVNPPVNSYTEALQHWQRVQEFLVSRDHVRTSYVNILSDLERALKTGAEAERGAKS